MALTRARRAVLAQIGGRALAIPVEHVVETMRPLPIIPLTAEDTISDYALGYSRIRGEDCQVIDAARLLAVPAESAPTRFLIIRDGQRRVALQVEAVLDVRELAGTPVGPVAVLAAALADARWQEVTP